MRKILSGLIILTVLATVAFTGCGQSKERSGSNITASQEETAASASTKPANKELKKFRVGYLPSTGHVLYFVAKEKGYFEEEGLDVEFSLFANSAEGLNAMKAGKLDAGSFGTAPPLTFIAKGTDFTIFGGQMSQGHALIAKPENADTFKDLKNYKGKKIGVVRLSTGDIVFRGGLKEAGLDWSKDLTINEFESQGSVLEAVKKGTVDAGIVWPPYRKMAEDQGLKVVKQSGEIFKEHPCCRQVALTADIKKDPDSYLRFTTALIKAYKFYKNNLDETVEYTAKYIKVDKNIIKSEVYGDYISNNPDPNKEGVVKFWDFMNKIGFISSADKIEKYINTDIFKNALNNVLKSNPEDKDYLLLKSGFKE